MKALKTLGFAFAGVVAVIAMVLVFKSPQSHMQRSVVIQAPPASVYQQLISFKNFNAWSPWAKLDPNTRYTYEGPRERSRCQNELGERKPQRRRWLTMDC